MANFVVTGKLGGGKSLVCVGRAFEYLRRGCRVATNMDLFLSGYLSPQSKRTYTRIPDKPTLYDLEAIGLGSDKVEYDENGSPIFNEEDHGLLILEELGSWFNARSWQDKGRAELIDYLIHLRKRGWDALLIVQDIDLLDKQLRGILAEHLVICRRLDRVKIPFFGTVMQWFGLKGTFPKVHRAKVYYGETAADMVVDTWTYIGKDFYKAYNTKQIFTANYPHGPHSVLSPWHTKGRYMDLTHPFVRWFLQKLDTRSPNLTPRKPKNVLVERIMRLPDPQKRIEFIKRFQACGAL